MIDPLHIVCPHCSATNRVLPERTADKPKCGPCRMMAPEYEKAAAIANWVRANA
jgi:thiol-disulfide isomerase/thioredoxin